MIIKNGKIITENEIIEGSVEVDKGKIIKIYNDKHPKGEGIDVSGCFISPGFIDIHIHGIEGHDCMQGDVEAINEMSKSLIKHGVTSFLPTTMTEDYKKIKEAIEIISKAKYKGTDGAKILGINLEGPFISPFMAGAQDPKYIKKPSFDTFKDLANDYINEIKIVTIAPEEEGAIELITKLNSIGIIASAGHTKGNYDDFINGYKAGIKHCTHLFNAMSGFHHRQPNIVGGVFDSDVTAEMILDGVHIHFGAARVALKIKGIDKIIFISDAMMACGLCDGLYSLGGQDVYVKNGQARLEDGTLAGSTLTLSKALYNALNNFNITLIDAVKAVTSNPAKLLKLDNEIGYIKEGFNADIVVFDDDINIKHVFVNGKMKF